jgi:type IV secretion system protein VirB2
MRRINIQHILIALIATMVFSPELMAAGAGGAMPWEGPLTIIVTSITGPVAFGISVIGIVAAGAMLIFGGEIGQFLKSSVILVLVIALLVFATQFLTSAFGIGAALIG